MLRHFSIYRLFFLVSGLLFSTISVFSSLGNSESFLFKLEGVLPIVILFPFLIKSVSRDVKFLSGGHFWVIFYLTLHLLYSLLLNFQYPNYIFTDYLRIIFCFLLLSIPLDKHKKLYENDVIIFLVILNLIALVIKIGLTAVGKIYGGGGSQYLVSVFFVYFVLKHYKNSSGFKSYVILFFSIPILIVAIVFSILSFKRGIIVGLAFIFLFIFISQVGRKWWIFFAFTSVILLLLFYQVLSQGNTWDSILTLVDTRFFALDSFESLQGDSSVSGRVLEINYALNYFQTKNIFFQLVGLGNGALFPIYGEDLGKSSLPGYLHHIHNSFILILFRTGYLGLLCYLYLFYNLFRKAFMIKDDILLRSALIIYLIFSFVSAFQANIALMSLEFSCVVIIIQLKFIKMNKSENIN